MPAPASLASIGAQRPGATYPALAATRDHDRFADVRAIISGTMPRVRSGQVWADCDPRAAGRTVRVLAVRADGKAVVETVTPGKRGPAAPQGLISVIAVRRFRPNSRGFALVTQAPKGKKRRASGPKIVPAGVPTSASNCGGSGPRLPAGALARPQEIESIAGVLAAGNPVLPLDYRAAAALLGLLGIEATVEFLASTTLDATPVRRYNDHGVGVLLIAATDWASGKGLIAAWSEPGAQ